MSITALNTVLSQPKPATAAFILRLTLGGVLIAHSLYLKAFVFGLAGTAEFFDSIGLWSWLAYVVFAAEAIGGIALIIGAYTRLAALAVVPVLLGATWAHLGSGWLFSNAGGGYEYPLVLSVLAIVQFYLGGGRFALIADDAELGSQEYLTLQAHSKEA